MVRKLGYISQLLMREEDPTDRVSRGPGQGSILVTQTKGLVLLAGEGRGSNRGLGGWGLFPSSKEGRKVSFVVAASGWMQG